MKKRILGLALILLVAATVIASAQALPQVTIMFDGEELESDVAPLIQEGRVLVPLRVIAERFGAEVNWDGENYIVEIITRDGQTDGQVAKLEEALAPKDPLTAVARWAEGVKTRNAALQLAVMAPELKEELQENLSAGNWTTGTSSPWIESFEITERAQLATDACKYQVEFTYADNAGNTSRMRELVTVEERESRWLVSSLEKVDIRGKIAEVMETDPEDGIRRFLVDSQQEEYYPYDKAVVSISDETKILRGDSDEIFAGANLQEGLEVEVIFEGPLLTSYPVQGGAGTIRVFE